jgi:propionate CoA-transferase
MVLNEKVEAWCLPMGSISRMIRAQSTHSPGHITTIGIGTYVDPDLNGGAANEKATKSPFHKELVTKIDIQDQTFLNYKALPVDVAIIRGTTADTSGNISIEHESLMCDQQIVAAAAKNSGGLVIAQVKRVAANGSIPSRQVAIPGPLVDCVVVVDDDEVDLLHPMSYVTKYDAALVGEVKTPQESIEKMPLSLRKIIARRAFFGLKPNTIVNLGIGLPEGVASVAAEEGMLEYITLSTEPGVFGGLPASGHDFGPAYNASSLIQMNQMFDFYDGGGLDMCFLGAAQVGESGDINVSRMSADRLTGPGGFIDISQSTQNVCFMTPLTTGGLKVEPGEGKLNIVKEGEIKKFVPEVYEKTFSGDEAVRRGQKVFYVTERAVFRRSSASEKLELIEIAPGVDLQKDVIDQMGFEPVISPNLKEMDPRIFTDAKMKATKDFFGSLEDRHVYQEEDHTVFLDMFGIVLNSQDDIDWFEAAVRNLLQPYYDAKGPVNMVVDYEGFEIGKGLEEYYSEKIRHLQENFYRTVVRYSGAAFQRAKLKSQLHMEERSPDDLFDEFSSNPESDMMSLEELREGFQREFQIQLTPTTLHNFLDKGTGSFINREQFKSGMKITLSNRQ